MSDSIISINTILFTDEVGFVVVRLQIITQMWCIVDKGILRREDTPTVLRVAVYQDKVDGVCHQRVELP